MITLEKPIEKETKGAHKSSPSNFNFDDIPISTKKLTFEELLAKNLQNESVENEAEIFGKHLSSNSKNGSTKKSRSNEGTIFELE